ncbi:MAG: PaaI family thioesterase [Aquificae bacterium]|nr:PaaI family thioesterase [Aquificota bacterium]
MLNTTSNMKVDEKGLVHGGFIFGAADFCAMLCVNHPNVVLASSHVKFLKPSKVGDILFFEASLLKKEKNKRVVKVIGYRQSKDDMVFEGEFLCIIPKKHVLGK